MQYTAKIDSMTEIIRCRKGLWRNPESPTNIVMQGTCVNTIGAVYVEPRQASQKLEQNMKYVPIKSGTTQGCLLLPTLSNTGQEERTGIKEEKGEAEVSMLADVGVSRCPC